jgi:hypothetical protein
MIGPRPTSPYLPIYPEADHQRIQEAYLQAEAEWQRAAAWTMALTAVLAVVMAALLGPQIVVDAIMVFSK